MLSFQYRISSILKFVAAAIFCFHLFQIKTIVQQWMMIKGVTCHHHCKYCKVCFFWLLFSVISYVYQYLPQILRGASSSRRMGWLRKISRDFRHRPLTSASVIWTILPGLHPLTGIKIKHIYQYKIKHIYLYGISVKLTIKS